MTGGVLEEESLEEFRKLVCLFELGAKVIEGWEFRDLIDVGMNYRVWVDGGVDWVGVEGVDEVMTRWLQLGILVEKLKLVELTVNEILEGMDGEIDGKGGM